MDGDTKVFQISQKEKAMAWEPPPYEPITGPDNQYAQYLNYEHYKDVTLQQSYQHVLDTLGSVPAGEAFMLIVYLLMPLLQFNQELQIGEAAYVDKQDALVLQNLSAMKSDFAEVGSILNANFNATTGSFNLSSDDQNEIDSLCQDAASQMHSVYMELIVPAYQDAGNSGYPTQQSGESYGGPFGSVAQSFVDQIYGATGLTLSDIKNNSTYTNGQIIENTWENAWTASFSSEHQSGNSAQLQGINTAMSSMDQASNGLNSSQQANIKMLSDEESMLMGINQSTEKAILGMISNINQHLASAGS
jgi:hypothetical protein